MEPFELSAPPTAETVGYSGPGWYFWVGGIGETSLMGPYPSKDVAQDAKFYYEANKY